MNFNNLYDTLDESNIQNFIFTVQDSCAWRLNKVQGKFYATYFEVNSSKELNHISWPYSIAGFITAMKHANAICIPTTTTPIAYKIKQMEHRFKGRPNANY